MNIAEKKEEILEVCLKAKQVYCKTWGRFEGQGCGCPLTLYAESLGWIRIDCHPTDYLKDMGFTDIGEFVRDYDSKRGWLSQQLVEKGVEIV